MAGGVLYNSTSFSQAYALDAATGKLLWVFDPRCYQAGTPPNFGFINRGLALWSNATEKRIFLATGDSRLIALNAADGRAIANWGKGGEVNLLEGLGLEVPNELYGVSSPPLVCGEAVIVGSSILEFPPRPDMETGEHAWMTPVGRGYEQLPQFKGREMPAMGIPNRTFVAATSNLLLAAQEGINLVVGTSPERNAARYQASPYMPSLKAFDPDNGELFGEVALPGNATGALMTYEINGKPFIVIPIGGAGLPAHLIALTLP